MERMKEYETVIYTDSQIRQAKADRAALNRLKKALNDERIRREKEYMKPFEEFKAQVNEIISIIDKPVALIDKQVKEYEEAKKQEKLEEIRAEFDEINLFPDWLRLEMIFEKKWLNASYSMTKIKEELKGQIDEIQKDLATIRDSVNYGDFWHEMERAYYLSLDVFKALQEGQKLAEVKARREEEARKRAEAEEAAKKAVPEVLPMPEVKPEPEQVRVPSEDGRMWVSFSALMDVKQALALREFFEGHGIEYKAI
jgi:hypothetical protein